VREGEILETIPPIRADEPLVRHIHPDHWNDVEDRPISYAFAHPRLSVDREEMRSADVSCTLRPAWGFCRFLVSHATALRLEVQAAPLGTETLPLDKTPTLEYNPAHAMVLGPKARVRKLRDSAVRIYRPGECPGFVPSVEPPQPP
jgi:hypothetical protein